MSKSNTTHRIHVILRPAEYELLTRRAKETGAPLSELIRRAITTQYTKKANK